MTAFVIDARSAEDMRDVIHRGVETLSSGGLVALPTETVYGLAASALHPASVKRLAEMRGRDPGQPLALAIKSLDDALDYVPDLTPLARRVARRSWPGPITLVVDARHPDSVLQRLDPVVRNIVVPSDTVGLRVPAHEITLQILRLLAGPLVLTGALLPGGTPLTEGRQVVEGFKDQLDLIIDDGPSHYGGVSSVVKIVGANYEFLRVGVVDEEAFQKLTGFVALVVCTGNTCRSPMGEALLKRLLAQRVGCEAEALEERGVSVLSAGVAAMPGGAASMEAVDVMKQMGLDISAHCSQPISQRMAEAADVVFTMTRRHRDAILQQWPHLSDRVHTVMRDGSDVADPIGMPPEVYQRCAQQIEVNLEQWVNALDLPGPQGK